jgi:hypothetical protein
VRLAKHRIAIHHHHPPPPARARARVNSPPGTAVVVVSLGRCRLLTSCLAAWCLPPAALNTPLIPLPPGGDGKISGARCELRRVNGTSRTAACLQRIGAPKGCREALPLVTLAYRHIRTDRWLHPCMELTVQRSVPTPTYYRQYRVVRSKYSRKQQDMIDQYQETAGYDRSVPFER